MLRRIILHIGTHKTGTTALQNLMAQQRKALAKAGVCYPDPQHPDIADLTKHSAFYKAVCAGPDQARQAVEAVLAEARAQKAHTLILSEEGFSEPLFDKFAPLAALRDVAEVEVVCLLRRQDRFIESIWNQYCKEGRETRGIADFAQAPGIRARCDYPSILAFWSQIGRVHVDTYEAAQATGLQAHFFAATGIRLPGKLEHANPSLGMNAALLHSWLNDRKWPVETALMQAFGRDLRRLAMGSRLRAEVLADHAAINAQLLRDHGVRFDDALPQEPEEPLTAPDRDFLLGLLIDLAPLPPDRGPARALAQLSPEDLRDAALALRASRPEAALRFIQAAHALRPAGPMIRRILNELEATMETLP